MTAGEIVALLQEKHRKDVCFAEVKDGPTWFGGHLRLDFWTMKPSWSSPCITVYEVKVSRSDFVKDDKWQGYLPLCNRFSFVAPAGTIDPDEVGPEAGLLLVSKTGTRLYTKKKAPYRPVDPAATDSLFRYLLMSRTRPSAHFDQRDEPQDRAQRIAWWKDWLMDRQAAHDIGYRVSRAVTQHVNAVNMRCLRLESENKALGDARELLKELGVQPGGYALRNRLKDALAVVPPELRTLLTRAQRTLEETVERLDALQKTKEEGHAD